MAAKPSNIRFMSTKTGRVHVVTTPGNDRKNSKCGVVKANHGLPVATGGWGKRKGISPEAALEMLDCQKCGTHAVAEEERKLRMTPAQKRAAAKERRDDTMDKIAAAGKPVKKSKPAKDPKEPKRRGPKGGDATERMKANVEEHAKLAEQHGWKAKAWESGTSEWTCEATKGGETLKLIYRDGRTVWSRVVLRSGVEVRLRNSSNWRKHATGDAKVKPDYQPRGAASRKVDRKKVVNDDAPRRLPFDLETDDDDTIIESLLGKSIMWRNGTSGNIEESFMPTRPRNIRIAQHPKSGRSMVSWFERQGRQEGRDGRMEDTLGIERTVYLDKILKAV